MGDHHSGRHEGASSIRAEERGGEAVVVKRAHTAAERRRLSTEAAILGQLRHPGVVELASSHRDAADELATIYAGSITLADYSPPSVGAVAAVMAAVAALLADIHSAGIQHGAVSGDHVIVGAGRRPILCSFSRATRVTPEGRRRDAEALVAVMDELLVRCPAPVGRADRRDSRALQEAVAEWSASDGASAELAAALAALPCAHSRAEAQASEPPASEDTRTWRDRVPPEGEDIHTPGLLTRWWPALAAATAAALVTMWSLSRSAPPPPPTAIFTSEPTAEAPSEPVFTEASACTETCLSCTPGEAIAVGGCGTEFAVIGNLVRVDGTWFEAGAPGDVVRVGDWNCDGMPTPAVLRPTTGDVFVFDSWAGEEGGDLELAPAASARGAVGLAAERTGDCDTLVGLDADGAVVERVSAS